MQKDRNSQIEGDKDQITVTSDWKLESDRWYTVMLETQGEEVLLGELSGESAPHLVAKFIDPCMHNSLIDIVVLVHPPTPSKWE